MTLPNRSVTTGQPSRTHPLFPYLLELLSKVDAIAKESTPASVEHQAQRLLSKASEDDITMSNLVEMCKKAATDLAALWHEEQVFEKDFKSMLGNGQLWADVDSGLCDDNGKRTPLKRKQAEVMTKDLQSFHMECDSNSRKRSKIPKDAADELRNWFLEHQSNPYPTRKEKAELVQKTGLSATQVRNWFTNIRKRHWAPVRKGREPRSFLDVVVQRHMLVEKAQGSGTSALPMATGIMATAPTVMSSALKVE